MALKINAEDSRPPKLSVRFFTEYHIPVSALSVVVAIAVSCSVGILFGTAPTIFAAGLDPVDSMRHE
jgi:ABC-type antimicrobial peptide transport system permease subunit